MREDDSRSRRHPEVPLGHGPGGSAPRAGPRKRPPHERPLSGRRVRPAPGRSVGPPVHAGGRPRGLRLGVSAVPAVRGRAQIPRALPALQAGPGADARAPGSPPPVTDLAMALGGLHHITLISSNMERTTRFYTETLGLRLIKQTVNFDDPSAKHFYFGDGGGTPGTLITYFYCAHLPTGHTGAGLAHHFAFAVEDDDALARWWVRLQHLVLQLTDPRPRRYFTSIYFRDPDGVILEIATRGPGFAVDEPADALGRRDIIPPGEFLKEGRADVPPPVESLSYDG